ncbi:MAG: ABC transporter permease [Aggregatilineales bacterium]
MRHFMQVFTFELRRNFQRRGYLLTTFGVPLLFIAIFLLVNALNRGPTTQDALNATLIEIDQRGVASAGYVDHSGILPPVPERTRALSRFETEAEARAALEAGAIEAYYVIAEDYLETGKVQLVMANLSLPRISPEPVRTLLLNALTQGLEPQLVARLLTPAIYQETNLAIDAVAPGPQSADASMLLVYIFALALLLGLFTTNGYLMQTVIEEKETRLIEILIATMRPFHLLSGKIIAMGLLGLLQMVVWVGGIFLFTRLIAGWQIDQALGIIAAMANIRLPLEILPILLVVFVLAYALFGALYGMIGALSNSMREGPQYAVIFTLPAVIPLYFMPLFATSPDGPIPVVMSFIPITAPLALTQRLVISTVPIWQIVLSIALLLLTVIFVLWLSARLFRVQTLLAGQPPKLRDLPALLRG